ncbi:MAG: polysaccharide deacetylase family protein [Thermoplasmata archaeon]|jgi:peptidoglycan/xylan/chitin deacetylase (PgdA/CDA1 family)|nr:polysaccharide deacetylase [Euryarchaeota archaeon]
MIWPNNAKFAFSFTFDVDIDSFWRQKLISNGYNPEDPVVLSMGRYGANVGLNRILKLLEKYGIKATFFVPGEIAERYSSLIMEIKNQGHEIAHHGYEHLDLTSLSPERQIEEIVRGKRVLQEKIGITPVGFRSPGGINTNILDALVNNGIIYDSSLMDDDKPYIYQFKNKEIVEIPWRYTIDDFVFYAFNYYPSLDYLKCHPINPRMLKEIWEDEFDTLYREGSFMTIIGHPHLIGQPSRTKALEEFIKYILRKNDIWITTYKEIAEYVKNNRNYFKNYVQD